MHATVLSGRKASVEVYDVEPGERVSTNTRIAAELANAIASAIEARGR